MTHENVSAVTLMTEHIQMFLFYATLAFSPKLRIHGSNSHIPNTTEIKYKSGVLTITSPTFLTF